MSTTSTTLYLLRHGLPEGDNCLRGHTDFALTPKGFKQMQSSVSTIAELDLIFTSPLTRCETFARYLANKMMVDCQLTDELKEYDFGDWDGLPFETLWQRDAKALGNFFEKPWQHTPPNGESPEHFRERLNNFWQTLVDSHQGKRILICTHSGVIRHYLATLLKLPTNSNTIHNVLNLPYASIIKVMLTQDEQGQVWPNIEWPVNYLE